MVFLSALPFVSDEMKRQYFWNPGERATASDVMNKIVSGLAFARNSSGGSPSIQQLQTVFESLPNIYQTKEARAEVAAALNAANILAIKEGRAMNDILAAATKLAGSPIIGSASFSGSAYRVRDALSKNIEDQKHLFKYILLSNPMVDGVPLPQILGRDPNYLNENKGVLNQLVNQLSGKYANVRDIISNNPNAITNIGEWFSTSPYSE